MKNLETSKEISKTFNVMKMCHVQKTTKTVAKKRKSSEVQSTDHPVTKVLKEYICFKKDKF